MTASNVPASDANEKRWRMIGALFLGGLFIFAAVSKLLAVYEFRNVVDVLIVEVLGGSQLPLVAIRNSITILVPGVEVAVGAALLIQARAPRIPAAMAMIMLLAFSGTLLLIRFMDRPPSCGCFGSWDILKTDARTGATIGLVRNVGLLVLSGWLCMKHRGRIIPVYQKEQARTGFTLIELLVAIVIISVLIALMLPALAGAKKQGKTAEILSAHRQSAMAISQYTDAESGFLPFLATPGHPEDGVFPDGDWGNLWNPSYFRGQSYLWPTALLSHGLDLSSLPQNSIPEEGPDRIHTYLWMTYAAFTRPEYWVGEDPPNSMNLFTGVRFDEVVFPSNKGLLVDVGHLDDEKTTWTVSMFDGSAAVHSLFDPSNVVDGLGRRYDAVPWRVLTTYEGIRGRDY